MVGAIARRFSRDRARARARYDGTSETLITARCSIRSCLEAPGAAHDVRHALLAVEGIFLLRGLGFVEVSAAEHKSVLLHARDIVAGVLAGRRAPRRRTSRLGRKPPLRGA